MQTLLEYGNWIICVILAIAAVFVFIGWRKGEKIKSDRIDALLNSKEPVFFKIVNYGGEDFYCIDFQEKMTDPAVVDLKKFKTIQAVLEMTQIPDKPS